MLQNFSIEVYDTTLPAWEQVPLENARAGSLVLSYKGEDTKTNTMLPSTLEFTMEVNMAPPAADVAGYTTDAFFEHLFTGNETRYQVHFRDEDTNKILWRGHLLPEQYTEPYTQGTFYVRFTATDGIARLRGKRLPDGMYRGRSSVAHILANCLRLTGLNLQIWLTQGIINAAPNNRFREINKWFYNLKHEGSGPPPDAYTILQELLVLMQCVVFQQDDRWYVVGLNQMYRENIVFYIYSPFGVLLQNPGFIKRRERFVKFLATPDVSIEAPFKRVLVDNDGPADIDLIPGYVAPQSFERYFYNQRSDHPKQWKSFLETPSTNLVLTNIPVNLLKFEDWEDTTAPVSEIVYPGISKSVSGNVNTFDYWIETANQLYVKAGQKIKISMELYAISTVTSLGNSNFKYAIAINTTAIYSNRALGNIINLDITSFQKQGVTYYDAKLEVEEFTAPMNGFVLVRLYPLQGSAGSSFRAIGVKKLEFTLIDDVVPVVKARDIDFVTEHVVPAKINDVFAGVGAGIVLDDRHTGFTLLSVWILPNPYFVTFSVSPSIKQNYTNALGIQPHLIDTVKANILKLFLLRKDSDYYEPLKGAQLVTLPQAFYGFLYINTFDDYTIKPGDSIYYKTDYTGFDLEDTLEREEARQQWQKTEANTGTKRLHQAMAELVHDIHPAPQIKMEGVTEHLVFPLDKLWFFYKNTLKSFMSLRIDNTLDRGQCRVTMIEDTMQKVTDYE